jgi:hypothetical protein
MIWTLDWSIVAERDLREIPWRLAARVDAAVMALAAGRPHEGRLERMAEADPYRLRLRLLGASALLWVEPSAGVLHVVRVLRNS